MSTKRNKTTRQKINEKLQAIEDAGLTPPTEYARVYQAWGDIIAPPNSNAFGAASRIRTYDEYKRFHERNKLKTPLRTEEEYNARIEKFYKYYEDDLSVTKQKNSFYQKVADDIERIQDDYGLDLSNYFSEDILEYDEYGSDEFEDRYNVNWKAIKEKISVQELKKIYQNVRLKLGGKVKYDSSQFYVYLAEEMSNHKL